MPPQVGMAAGWVRTADFLARAVMHSAGRTPGQGLARIHFRVPLRVSLSLHVVTTTLAGFDSEATASRITATVTGVSVTDLPLVTRASTIRTGGGIRVPRSTTISNIRLVWRTR